MGMGAASATLRLGYRKPLKMVVDTFEGRIRDKQRSLQVCPSQTRPHCSRH